jgi:hypothetical protein
MLRHQALLNFEARLTSRLTPTGWGEREEFFVVKGIFGIRDVFVRLRCALEVAVVGAALGRGRNAGELVLFRGGIGRVEEVLAL